MTDSRSDLPAHGAPPPAPPPRKVELIGATWGFAPETTTHALRPVFQRTLGSFPTATVILGHLGETLPAFAWRVQHCFEYKPAGRRIERRVQDYLADNFYVTTSGNFSDQALISAILAIGADRTCLRWTTRTR